MAGSSNAGPATGYCSEGYARSLSHLGELLPLERSGGWCLRRRIPGAVRSDAMGPYPLLCCADWPHLAEDLEALTDQIVSFSCVVDPLADVSDSVLDRCFPDRRVAFKTHYGVDLGQPLERFVSNHHQRYARRALERLEIGVCSTESNDCAGPWIDLYANLVRRHRVEGLAAFPPASLAAQLEVLGATVFMARHGGDIVGMQVWMTTQGRAYYHLGAYTDSGYEERASFGLMWFALRHFREQGLERANLGGGAGVRAESDDGLVRFKAGWSNMQRTAYIGGRILDHAEYDRLSQAYGNADADFFPAYRTPRP